MPVEHSSDRGKGGALGIKNRVLAPVPASGPDAAQAEDHHGSVGQRVSQTRPETAAGTRQPAEDSCNFPKAIAETQPRVLANEFQSLLPEPFIHMRFVATARPYLALLLGIERL